MKKDILVINAGSSSLKFRLYDFELKEKASGICERIGVDGFFKIEFAINENTTEKFESSADFKNHELAIDYFLNKLIDLKIVDSLNDIKGVGHRIVQGGSTTESSLVDEKILKVIEDNIKLAPLHNKPELDVLKIIIDKIKGIKNVAVFDTSFHTTIPKINSYYPIPQDWIEKYGIKKYGFHGTSYRFINEKMQNDILKLARPLNLIICHLGNGASVCCIKNGKSFDTTMGLTPLSGLVMATRCGDVDPSIFDLIYREEKLTPDVVFDKLNKVSGFKSICGATDFRDINANVEPGNEYDFTKQLFVQKIVNFISIYKNMLNENVDGIVFTGGIGENGPDVRKMVCDKIPGIDLNKQANESKIGEFAKISNPLSKYNVFVVRTNEELKIAEDTKAFIKE